jgi:hypothetical protein
MLLVLRLSHMRVAAAARHERTFSATVKHLDLTFNRMIASGALRFVPEPVFADSLGIA